MKPCGSVTRTRFRRSSLEESFATDRMQRLPWRSQILRSFQGQESLSQTFLFYWLHGTTCPGAGKEASHHALQIKWMTED